MSEPRKFPPLVKGSMFSADEVGVFVILTGYGCHTLYCDDEIAMRMVRYIAAGEWRDEARRAWNSVSHPRDCGGGGKWFTDYHNAIENAEAWENLT